MEKDLELIVKAFVRSEATVTEQLNAIRDAKTGARGNSFWLQSNRNLQVLYALLSAEFSKQNLSISGIARQIGTSRPNISRILKDARSLGLINDVNSPTKSSRELVNSSVMTLLSNAKFMSQIKEFVFRSSLFKLEEEAGNYSLATSHSTPEPPEPLDTAKIAVLPFSDFSEIQNQGVFVDGLLESITEELTRFKDLDVISPSLSSPYRGQTMDIRRAGRELGANYILEGSIRGDANALRIHARLLDSSDGSTLWSQHFDRSMQNTNSLPIQDELSVGIASSIGDLSGVLDFHWQGIAVRTDPNELSSDRSVALVNAYFQSGSEEDHLLARDVIERARERDPNNSDVLAMVANVYRAEHWLSHNSLPDPLNRALDAASQAVELDRTSDRAYSSLASVHMHRGENNAFRAAADQVLKLAPTSNFRIAQMGNLYYLSGDRPTGMKLLNSLHSLSDDTEAFPNKGLHLLPFFYEAYREKNYHEALRVVNLMAMPRCWVSHALSFATASALNLSNEADLAKFRLQEIWPDFVDNGHAALTCLYADAHLAGQMMSYMHQLSAPTISREISDRS